MVTRCYQPHQPHLACSPWSFLLGQVPPGGASHEHGGGRRVELPGHVGPDDSAPVHLETMGLGRSRPGEMMGVERWRYVEILQKQLGQENHGRRLARLR